MNILTNKSDLDQIISNAVEQKFFEIFSSTVKTKPDNITNQTKYLLRSEAAKRLRLSLPTLDKHTQAGDIKAYRIGGRILYKSDDIDAALVEIPNK